MTPDSASVRNVIYDNVIAHDKNLDIITNSLISKTLINRISMTGGSVHNIDIINDLPNYIGENGPDREAIHGTDYKSTTQW